MSKDQAEKSKQMPSKYVANTALRTKNNVFGNLYRSLEKLSPNYFGLVMATGIVSIAAYLMGYDKTAYVLFYLNIAQYISLCVLYAVRAVHYPRRFFGDMVDHLNAPGYFTIVAGTGILDSQFLILTDNLLISFLLWLVLIVLWLALTYTIFTALTVKPVKPTLAQGINGGWLLAVVATQSVAVTSSLLSQSAVQPLRLELNFLALSMWLWGGMLYTLIMSLIFYRYVFFKFSPADLTPPYWINMGAMAISTLAGSLLILNADQAPYLISLLPFLKGFTVFYWAAGTWWIPMLLLLGIWRHIFQKFPFNYNPLYWGAVFPFGMYATCTYQMNKAMDFDFLSAIPYIFIYAAFLAWGLTFFGMVKSLVRHAVLKPSLKE